MAEYINKETAISLIKQYGYDAIDGVRYSLDTVDDCIELANRIKTLPTEDVAPVVHGRWVQTKAPFMNECEDCSVCGYRTVWGHRYNYCPNCGAKMNIKDGGDNNAVD